MVEPFKNLLNAPGVRAAAVHLQRARPGFDAGRFAALACEGLDTLEMKARALHICSALQATLPVDFDDACAQIEAALAPPEPDTEMGQLTDLSTGLRGWVLWPVGEFIARQGLQRPERALAALHALTQRFTAEWALRPFIVQHPQLCWATLQRWCSDPSPHVRRLVSEGSRPRLPWGLRLQALVADPRPTLPLLRALQDDPSAYVRRSVANHLNDVAKDHPALLLQWLQQHLPGASAQRRALLQHASRSLIKQADPAVLQVWGLGTGFEGCAALELQPTQARVGQDLLLRLHLRSTAAQAQRLLIDYRVHHVKARGHTQPKVFKGWQISLPAGASLTLHKRHSLRPVTTRRYHPGLHRVDVQINGHLEAGDAFALMDGSG